MRKYQIDVTGKNIEKYVFEVADSCPEFLVEWLTGWFTEYINKGAIFDDEQNLQYGFTELLCSLKDNTLKLSAPDFQSMPIKWVDDLSNAFFMMMEHKYVPESFDLEIDIPSLAHTAIVGKQFEEFPIIMSRTPKSKDHPADSGWFIGSARDDVDNNNPDNLQLMSLYEVVIKSPQTLRFLSMPVHSGIFLDVLPKVFFQEQAISPKEDSYLSKKIDFTLQNMAQQMEKNMSDSPSDS